jgi:hypothetical protein
VDAFRYLHPNSSDEREKESKPNIVETNVGPVIEEKIILHRLPYMKMDPSITIYVTRLMFVCMFLLAIQNDILD